jgi:hypothetical protein
MGVGQIRPTLIATVMMQSQGMVETNDIIVV